MIFKKLYSKLVKKSTKSPEVKAYCAIGLADDDQIIVTVDSKDPDSIVKIMFVALSDIFSDSVMKTVADKYKDDPELLKQIFSSVGKFLENYESESDSNEDVPVVDPCKVFNNKKGIEDYEEFEE